MKPELSLANALLVLAAMLATVTCKPTDGHAEPQPAKTELPSSKAELAPTKEPKPVAAKTPDTVLPTQLAELLMTRESHKQIMRQSSRAIIQAIQGSGQKLPQDFSEKLDAIMLEALPYDEMLKLNAEVYSERFTPDELRDLIAFYRTKTGSKLVKELPEITQVVMTKVSALTQQRLPSLLKKHGLTQ